MARFAFISGFIGSLCLLVIGGLPASAEETLHEIVNLAAAEHGVDPKLIHSVIVAESGGRAYAVSSKGARGVMQLMPDTARRFGVTNPFDIQQSIRGGTEYLGWLLKRFGGDMALAIAGYNAGEGAVDKWGGVPPYPETRNYVRRVLARLRATGKTREFIARVAKPPVRSKAERHGGFTVAQFARAFGVRVKDIRWEGGRPYIVIAYPPRR